MSHKNPTVAEILAITTGKIGKHFHKSYLNLAKMAFNSKHKHWPTLDNAQELRDIYEEQWYDYYVGKPQREKQNKIIGKPIWDYTKQFRRDTYNAMCRFLEFKYSEFKNNGSFDYPVDSAGDIMKEKNIEFMETHIMENNLLDEYKQFVLERKTTLMAYFKPVYQDYSHLAYNGVTDDF